MMRLANTRWVNGVVCAIVLAGTVAAVSAASGAEGRWKDDGNGGCYFDATDSGPDQCPAPAGRWKVDGDGNCYWDAQDSGFNQCSPAEESAAETSGDHGGAPEGDDRAPMIVTASVGVSRARVGRGRRAGPLSGKRDHARA
jgi:hypothetical protein